MRRPKTMILTATACLCLGWPLAANAQAPAPKSAAELVDIVARTADRQAFYQAFSALDGRLRQGGPDAEAAAKLLLATAHEAAPEPGVRKALDGLASAKKPVLAAQLLLQIAKARQTVRAMKKGHVAVGRVVVEDGKLDPELVLAQMEILPEGYFAGEVGDLERPIGFRAEGYQNLEAPLEGKSGDLVWVGAVVLKPLPRDQTATLKGRVRLDASKDASAATVRVSLSVPPANTPHNGYSPRRRWPEPRSVPVAKTGEFVCEGLTPSGYYLSIGAAGHGNASKQVELKPGRNNDLGEFHLLSTDLGFYIGKPAPKTGELAWEKDYTSALKKAAAEKKPVMVMMTATWCGPCKMLEKETLNDPWVRSFLSDFVIVKAYEDKDVEKTYGLNGYPTLVFTDGQGKEASRTVGYQGTLPFTSEVVKAYLKLGRKLPDEIQALVDKKLVPARR